MTGPTEAPKRLWWIVGSLWLVMFTASSQFLIVSPILPRIGEALSIPEDLLGTLVSGYAFAVAACALIAGPISDQYGRRVVLRVGTAWMATALALHWFADSYASLLGLRILAGMASGIMAGASTAYIGDVVPYAIRGRALGVLLSGMAFGQILGIPLGTLIADRLGFQAPFTVFGGLMLLAFVAMMTIVPPAPAQAGETHGIGVALRSYGDLLKRLDVAAVALASTTMMFGVSCFIVYQPLWLETTFKVSSDQIASLFLVGGIANAGVGPFAGTLSDRIGRKWMVVCTSAGIGLFMAATPHIPSFSWAYGLFFGTMILVGARVSPLNALMTAMVDGAHRGSLMSLTMATGQLGFACGSAVAGVAYEQSGFALSAYMAAGSAVVTGLLLAGFVQEPDGDADGA